MTITREEAIRRVAADLFWCDMARRPQDRTELTVDGANSLLISCLVNRGIPWRKAMSLVDQMKQRTGYTDTLRMFTELTPPMIEFVMFDDDGAGGGSLHRFRYIADYCYRAMCRVRDNYAGSALNLWEDEPTGRTLLERICEFKGMGIKCSSLFVRIAVLSNGVVLWDKYAGLEVSPDVRVCRVMQRLGLVGADSTPQEVVKKAREMSPQCAVEIDGLWEVGSWCKASSPTCRRDEEGEPCPLLRLCPSAR